ncbi:MAG: hypothetical protein IKB10_02305 [Alphaproteobacteria bacterium]|nr:hypothetical protein [Alphaproteobacteria bacterium]
MDEISQKAFKTDAPFKSMADEIKLTPRVTERDILKEEIKQISDRTNIAVKETTNAEKK